MDTDNQFILTRAKELYCVEPVKENTMGASGNKIFEVKSGSGDFILRASEVRPHKKEHILFELDWMEYLSSRLSGIVRPARSRNGNLCEEVRSGSGKPFILCMLEKAPGKIASVNDPREFNEDLFFSLGALMGDMHRLTIDYPNNIRKPEFEWTGPPNFWRYENEILDEEVRRCQKKYFNEINRLPSDKDNYGIIHWDIHTDNFFVDSGKIKLFDFDACQFNWYAADMASAIFFMVMKGAGPSADRTEKQRTAFAEPYLISYLRGYLTTNKITEYWIDKIDLFIKYQMADEYLAAQSFWPEERADERDWYLNWHKDRITKGLPYVNIDYEKVINSVLPKSP